MSMTLDQALFLARTGRSKSLRLAAFRMHGIPINDGRIDEAWNDLAGWLPHRSERDFTINDWVRATNRVDATGRYEATLTSESSDEAQGIS